MYFTKDAITDFAIMSVIIVVSQIVRSRVKILQYLYMPSSIIAGLVCLFGGWQFLDILPFSVNERGGHNMISYPAFLVVLLFSTLFLGKRKKKLTIKNTIEHAGDTLFFNLASLVGQYGFSLLFGLLVMAPLFPELPKAFVVMLPAGFVGGHGTAVAVGEVLGRHGWPGALTIGYASATVGVLIGVFGGMILINLGTRRGWTRIIKSLQAMPASMKTGFLEESERKSLGKETVSPMALDPFTWHFAIVLGTAVIAFYLSDAVQKLFPGAYQVPVFCIALLLGGGVQKLFNLLNVGKYVDRHFVHRIGSWVTDYLVAFGIASITLKVVVQFAVPLALLFSFGTLLTLLLMWFIGRFICRNFWFERSLFMYGWNTGSVATSVVLLRVLDPDMRSQIIEDFGLAYIVIAFVEILIVAVIPPLVANGIIFWPMVCLLVAFVACLLLSRVFVGWFRYPNSALREGEAEVMAGIVDNE